VSLLEVEGLTVGLVGSPYPILREVSFSVEPGEILALVGESGSGKTMAALATMGLLPLGIEMTDGEARIEGQSMVDPEGRVTRTAAQISMIFQHPVGALNPTMRVGHQVGRVIQINQGLGRTEALEAAIEMLGHVGIPGPERVARNFPHQLSGGMCQRIVIAMAVACRPRILIADEPTTALDVTVQAQIFDLIKSLASEIGCGVIFITHDLGAVAEMADRVAVMYGGQVMEESPVRELLVDPRHPYTRYLLESITHEVDHRVEDIGVDFALRGCRFGHRCLSAQSECNQFPPLLEISPDRSASCFLQLKEPT
jgi:oligopeptide/dipeptide ABC transporter ATP-binding protein